ncbi:MAG: metal-dependent transcriptional regulator [Clostridia bacterium]|nr:metal-dependent transcriptional regulator [Clostridia bacterium]
MKIQQSAENYLETIYMLQKSKGSCRSVDIANELGFSKPSVSVAMKNLRENGYIDVMGDGNILLLEAGKKIAEELFEKHTILTRCLTAIGVPEEIAAEDACKIEHLISAESFEAIKNSLNRHIKIKGEE